MLHTLGFPRWWKITCCLYRIFHGGGKTHVAYIGFSMVVETHMLHVWDFPRWWKITCCLYQIFHGGGKTHVAYSGFSTVVENYMLFVLDFPRWWKITCCLYWIFHGGGKTHVADIGFSTVVEKHMLNTLDFPRWWKNTCCRFWMFHLLHIGFSTAVENARLIFPTVMENANMKTLEDYSYMDTGGRLLGSVQDLDHVFISLKLPPKLRRRF